MRQCLAVRAPVVLAVPLAVVGSVVLAGVVKAEDLAKARLDLSTPDVPAFTALGVSPSKISTPTNVKDFVAALSSGVSSSGQVQSGVAIEVAPAQLVMDFAQSNPRVDEHWARYLAGLAVSIGTNAIASATTPTMQAALGVRWALGGYTPQADPDLATCIVKGLPPVRISNELDENGVLKEPVQEIDTAELKAKRGACRDRFRVAHLASSALQIAYVHSAQAVGDSKLSSFDTLADTLWLSFSWGINKVKPPTIRPLADPTPDDLSMPVSGWAWGFQPTVFIRYDAFNLGSGLGHQSDLSVAARIPFITGGWSAFLEGGFQKRDLTDKGVSAANGGSKVPFGVGGDIRLGDGTWLGLYGGANLSSGEIFSLANVKWSIGEKRPYEY